MDWLPQGNSLPEADWRTRHRLILWILAVHIPVIVVFAVARGYGMGHGLLEALPIALPALAAASSRPSRNVRSVAATFGLISASAVLVHLSGGSIEMHFHFFVAVIIIAMYESWVTFLLAIAYVVIHHGLLGTLDPSGVFNHSGAINRPWVWAGVHGMFIVMESVAAIVFWRFNEVARERFAASEAKHRSIVETLQEGLWTSDAHGRTTYVNPAMAKMLGYDDQHDIVGQSIFEFVVPADRERVRQGLARHAQGFGDSLDLRMRRADGSEIWAMVNAAPLPRVDGAFAGALASVVDITARKTVEEDALRLHQARSAFIADASHELRTPLTVLTGMVQLLTSDRERLSPDEVSRIMEALNRQGDRTVRLVNSLLDFSRLDSGTTPRPVRLDLDGIIRRALAAAPPQPGRVVDVRVEEGLRAMADADSLERAIVNLLTNAYRYGGAAVAIEAVARDGHVEVAVQDDGAGVPADLLPSLFEPFTRGDHRSDVVGSGLGMAIVKRLVEGFGGHVRYETARPHGARFVVELAPVAGSVPAGISGR
jgi:PAS domain S-box-containing protein